MSSEVEFRLWFQFNKQLVEYGIPISFGFVNLEDVPTPDAGPYILSNIHQPVPYVFTCLRPREVIGNYQ